jgi:hypothetical protein
MSFMRRGCGFEYKTELLTEQEGAENHHGKGSLFAVSESKIAGTTKEHILFATFCLPL